MLKKRVVGIFGLIVGVFLLIGIGMAEASSEVSSDSSLTQKELLNELTKLKAEITQIEKMTTETREISIESRLEAAKFKEEVLSLIHI